MRFSSISVESVVLATVCLVDTLSTLVLVSTGAAVEANPFMAACLRYGAGAFVLIKLLSFLPFVIVTEWYRRRNVAFARTIARAAIGVYLLSYLVLTTRVNIG